MRAGGHALSARTLNTVSGAVRAPIGEDEWAGGKQALEMRDTMPNCELLTLADVDHGAHMTNPEVVNESLRKFLDVISR